MSGIRRLLADCLVRISAPGAPGGTGFFVAPGTVLTCAHVVTGVADGEPLLAEWNGGGAAARILAVHPAVPGLWAQGPHPYPDLAVLEVQRTGHPCVRLDTEEPRLEDRVHGCGYTRTWSREQTQVEPVTFTYEGVHEVGGGLLKLAGGQAVPGMSGGPLLNLRTMGVCGVLKTTRDANLPTGGWGVPVGLLRELHPDVIEAHDTFHRTDRRWRVAADAVPPLLAGLPSLSAGFAGRIENFLVEYLGRDGLTVPFGGRDPEMKKLSAWLSDPHAAPYALVAAEAGRGKSALLMRWAQEVIRQEQAHVVVIPVSIRFNTAQAGVVFPALATRLGEVYGEPPGGADMSAEQWKEACLSYLRRPPPGDRPLLVVMDGLDEATDWHPGPDLFPAAPAEGVRVLASARYLAGDADDQGWLSRLNWDSLAVSLPLPPMDREGVRQVLHAMGDPLAGLATKVDVVSELYRLSEGDPLLVRLYVEALLPYGEQAAAISPDDLPSISKGLGGYFERWWDEQDRQWRIQNRNSAAERQDLEDFLNALACALGPLSRDDLAGVLPRPLSSLRLYALTRDVGRFVIGDGRDTGFVYSHPRLGMFFRELMGQAERDAWETRFLAYGRRAVEQARAGAATVPPYAVRFHGSHLERAGAPDEDLYALVDGSWLHACQSLEGTDSTFLNDSERAWRRAEMRRDERAFEVRFLCALARASVAARSDGIPVPLLAAAVRAEIVTHAQALALCRRMSDERRRSAAVVRLAEVVGPEWIDECVAVAGTVQAEGRRAHTLAALSPRLSERSAHRALTVARSLEFPTPRAIALAAVSSRLPEDERLALSREALDTCAADEDGDRRGRAVTGMAVHLPETLRLESVRLARHTPDPLTCIRALCALARHLPESDAQAALHAARDRLRELPNDSHIVRARFALAEFASPADRERLLPSLSRVAPQVAHRLIVDAGSWIATTDSDSWPVYFKDNLLTFPPADTEQLVAVLPDDMRDQLVAALPEVMPAQGGRVHLGIARNPRAEHLLLFAHLLARRKKPIPSWRMEELLSLARHLNHPERAAVLTALAACRPAPATAELLREALDSAQLIDDVRPRINALDGVATDASEPALADLQTDLVFRPGRLADHEVRSFLERAGMPLADGAVAAAMMRTQGLVDRGAALSLLETYISRASERHRAQLGSHALREALAVKTLDERTGILQRLAVLLPELRARIEAEHRWAFERIQSAERRLELLSGAGGVPTPLSTAENTEELIRDLVVPLVAELSGADPAYTNAQAVTRMRPKAESLFSRLPQRLPDDLALVLWNTAARAESWLGPWLQVWLLSRLPADRVAAAVARLRALRFPSIEETESFRGTLADELTKTFHRLEPTAQSVLLDDALGRPVSVHRLRVLIPLAGADRIASILNLAQELRFPDRVATAGILKPYVDDKRFADFLSPLKAMVLPMAGVGVTASIDLVRLLKDSECGALLDAIAWGLLDRKPADWRKALRRLPAEHRRKLAASLLRWTSRKPWELTPVIADLPVECLRDVEQKALGIEDPLLRIGLLGALIVAAGRPTPDRLWVHVLHTARAEKYVLYSRDGLQGLLRRNVPDISDHWMQELRAVIDTVADPAERVNLLCALARRTQPSMGCAVLGSALDSAELITHDRSRAAALLPVAQSAAECPDTVVRALDAISGLRSQDGRQRALQALVPGLRTWIASGTADVAPWDQALRRLSRWPRPVVVRDMALLATAGAGFLPEDRCVRRAFLKALHSVGNWWS